MFKKAFLVILAFACLMLAACSTVNQYNISLIADGSGNKDYIYYDDERVVYTVGGIVVTEVEGESILLEAALADGKLVLSDILASAQADADNGGVETETYPDGSVEYYYDSYTLIVLNVNGMHDVYFVPSDMNYYSIIN